jgi:parvulin-like peptidyl-prolyl isomerase
MTRHSLASAAALAALCAAACGRSTQGDGARRAAAPPPADVVARVNGVPITRADLQREARPGGHPGLAPEAERDVLDGLVRQELAAQRAAELKLDPGPEYRAERSRLEAQLAALERRKLAEAFDRHVATTAAVSDEDARAYFEAERGRIRTELHLWQILVQDDARIEQARRDLEAGIPFEEVARRQFPELPASAGPFWDLGYLRWTQIPAPWRSALDRTEKGGTTGVIQGPKGRRWILKLVDRRENPDVTFESVKPIVVEALRGARAESLRAEAERELRARGRVEYVERATAR